MASTIPRGSSVKGQKCKHFSSLFLHWNKEKTCHLLVLVWTTFKKYILPTKQDPTCSHERDHHIISNFFCHSTFRRPSLNTLHTSNDFFERSTAAFLKSCPVNCLLVNWIQKTLLLSTQLKSRSQAIRNHGVTSNWLSQGEQAFTLRSRTKMYCFGFWEHRELSILQKKVSLDRNEITGLFSDSCFVTVIAPMADLLKGAEIIIVPDFRKN